MASFPDGAAIFLDGEDRQVGTTDATVAFESRDQVPLAVRLRKPGYRDEVRPVAPSVPIFVRLTPIDDGEPGGIAGDRACRRGTTYPQATRLGTRPAPGRPERGSR